MPLCRVGGRPPTLLTTCLPAPPAQNNGISSFKWLKENKRGPFYDLRKLKNSDVIVHKLSLLFGFFFELQ